MGNHARSNNEAIKEHLSNQCGQLYKTAVACINSATQRGYGWRIETVNGVKKYTKKDIFSGRTHEIRVDLKYNQTIYTLTGNKDDKKAGLVGTNGKSIVKILNENSYDYIKPEDFIDRNKLIYDAVRDLVGKDTPNNKYFIRDPQIRNQYLQWLIQQQEISETNIRNSCNLDIKKMRGKDNSSHFDQLFKNAKKIIKQSLVNVAGSLEVIATTTTNMTTLKRSDILADIQQAEKEFIVKQGRPFIIKIGHIGGNNKKLDTVSVQVPLGEKTIPSSLRTGDDDIKLSNHVRDGSGHIDSNGNIKLDLIIDGHSSYPPINVDDEMKRRHIASLAVKEKIFQIVSDILKTSPTMDGPLSIPLSAIMLLTPAFGKKTDQLIRSNESEYAQISDSRYALEMIRNTPQPMEIKVRDKNGILKSIQVNVDISYMNIPVNAGKSLQNLASNPMQKNINVRGFHEFSNIMTKQLIQIGDNPKSDIEKAASHALSSILQLQKQFDTEDVKKLEIELKNLQTNFKIKLADSYANLGSILTKYNAETNEDEKKSLKKRYKKVKKEINTMQDEIYKIYSDINKIKTNIFKKIEKGNEFSNCKDKINNLLKLIHQEKNPDKNKLKLRDYFLSQLQFINTQELFYSEAYLSEQNAYQFHVNYLLANEKSHRFIEAFCKSNEDRGGWLRILLLAHTVFQRLFGHTPDLADKKTKDEYKQVYAAPAYELSTSLENTKFNSEARGLQIEDSFTIAGVSPGLKTAKLAKGIFKDKDVLTLKADQQFSFLPEVPKITSTNRFSMSENLRKKISFFSRFPKPMPQNEVGKKPKMKIKVSTS